LDIAYVQNLLYVFFFVRSAACVPKAFSVFSIFSVFLRRCANSSPTLRLVQIHLQGVGAALGFDEDHAEPRAGQVVFDDLNLNEKKTDINI